MTENHTQEGANRESLASGVDHRKQCLAHFIAWCSAFQIDYADAAKILTLLAEKEKPQPQRDRLAPPPVADRAAPDFKSRAAGDVDPADPE